MIEVSINQISDLISQEEGYLMVLGPTATGKTALAFKLAERTNYDLISLDSRQVYRYFDVVTGKDIPKQFRFIDRGELSYYLAPSGFRVYGLSIADPHQTFNLARLIELLPKWWQEIVDRQRRPLFVGGTLHWFYRLLSNKYEDVFIPQNKDWRDRAEKMTIGQLREELNKLNPLIGQKLTNSDWSNKYRLIRWYERLSQPLVKPKESDYLAKLLSQPRRVILLDYSLDVLRQRIKKRIAERLDQGAILETRSLLKKYPSNVTAFNSPGYRQLIAFENGLLIEEELKKQWLVEEMNLVKKQKTWLKKIIPFVDFKIRAGSRGSKINGKPVDERPAK